MAPAAFDHGAWTSRARWLDGGRHLATSGADDVIRCWTRAGALVREFTTPGYRSCAAAVGGFVVAGSNGDDGTITLWDARSGEVSARLAAHTTATPAHRTGANTTSVAFSPDGTLLASGGFDDVVRLWDVASGGEVGSLPVGDMAWSLAFSPDGQRVAAGLLKGVLSVWSVPARARAAEAKVSKGAVTSVAFAGDRIVVGGGKGELALYRHEGASLERERLFDVGDRGGVEGVAVSPDGGLLAAASRARWLRVWDLRTGASIASLAREGSLHLDVAFTPDGSALATAGPPQCVVIDLAPSR